MVKALKDYEYFSTDNGTLYQGDCLEILPLLEDESVDLVLTDPPYGTTACKWDSVIPLDEMWANLKRVIAYAEVVVMTASQPFTTTLISSNPEMFKYCWVWDKKLSTGFLDSNRKPLKRHEDICVFYKSLPTYNPQKEKRFKKRWKGGDKSWAAGETVYNKVTQTKSFNNSFFPTSILEFSNAKRSGKVHPTQKPVALMKYLIKTYTNKNDVVLDFAIGSGTTAVACEELGRKWIGIELSKDYCEIAKKRLSAWKGQIRFF